MEEKEPEQLGFSFALLQPYIATLKQAIVWEGETPKKVKIYFSFL